MNSSDKGKTPRKFIPLIVFGFVIHLIIGPFIKLAGIINGKFKIRKWNRLFSDFNYELNKSNYNEAHRISIETRQWVSKIYGDKNLFYFISLICEASALRELGKATGAKSVIVKAESLFNEIGFEKEFQYYRMRLLQGHIEADLQEFKKAEAHYLEAFNYFNKAENKPSNYFDVLVYSIGTLYTQLGKTTEAQKYYSMSKT